MRRAILIAAAAATLAACGEGGMGNMTSRSFNTAPGSDFGLYVERTSAGEQRTGTVMVGFLSAGERRRRGGETMAESRRRAPDHFTAGRPGVFEVAAVQGVTRLEARWIGSHALEVCAEGTDVQVVPQATLTAGDRTETITVTRACDGRPQQTDGMAPPTTET